MKNWATLFMEDMTSDDGWEFTRSLIVMLTLSRVYYFSMPWIDSLDSWMYYWTTRIVSSLWSSFILFIT